MGGENVGWGGEKVFKGRKPCVCVCVCLCECKCVCVILFCRVRGGEDLGGRCGRASV